MLITAEECDGADHCRNLTPKKVTGLIHTPFLCCQRRCSEPLFNDPADQAALDKLRELFPDREVVGVYTREVLLGGGNIHCITQQQPKAGGL